MAGTQGCALVTGATGFLGSHLVEHLLRRGYHVRCLVRATSDVRHLEELGVERVQGDLRQADGLDECLQGVDIVFHVAGVTAAAGKRSYFEGNARATDTETGKKATYAHVSHLYHRKSH